MNLRDKLKFWIMLSNYVDMIVGPDVSPLSLPDAIADSLSYVKAFGGTEQRNLPDGYIERQFIYMMDGSYLLTDIVPTSDMRIEMDFQTTSMPAVGGSFVGSRNTTSVGSGIQLGFNSSTKFTIDGMGSRYISTNTIANNTRYKFTWNNGLATIETGGSVVDTNTFTPSGTNIYPLVINGLNNAGTPGGGQAGIYLYSFKVWDGQGELVMDLVPAVQKGTVPVVGFYDTVSKTFKTATEGTFAAGGEAVPTPDAPMDIVCNNGVLKARHQSGLPLGYQLLDYIYGPGNTAWIDTGVSGGSDSLRIDIKCYAESYGRYAAFFGNYVDEDTNTTRLITGSSSSGVIFDINRTAGGSVIHNTIRTTDLHEYSIYQDSNKQTILEVDGNVVDTMAYSEGTTNNTNIALNAANVNTTSAVGVNKYYYYMKIYNNSTLVRDLHPAKRLSDNAIGMYDTVSGGFFENAGTDDFTAGNAVSDPVEIYTDGTVETIEDTIGNTATAEMLLKVGDYQDVQSIIDGVVTRKLGVMVLTGAENGWSYASNQKIYYCNTLGFKRDDSYVAICTHYKGAPYSQITDLTIDNTVFTSYLNTNTGVFAFRHLAYSNTNQLAAWKQYLADQYAAGTPVIVIYPLATPTTESVAGQTLQVTDGDNVLEITQASLNGLELEASYKRAA